MNLHLPKIYSLCARRIHSDRSLMKNHYDALGLTTGATQADIKSAYYKLSMIYHPDRNKNYEDSKKFRDIKEAYEVLGNVKMRRLYDKGMVFGSAKTYPDTENKFYKSREYRSQPPPPSGRSPPIYDFDEWARSHYARTFARDQETKKFRQFQQQQRQVRINDARNEKLIIGIGIAFIICTLLFRSNTDYDRVTYVDSLPTAKKKDAD